ncbi:choice-of-anchor A family protein [Trichocoleus sp. FACHB-262]|uniref:choice-of-anchor A family protein n=1 Tax=Trichocoleus sp. FACHB-262 TaxID=2692869 RepID=UPI0016888A0E|nr:choice-of-anchor A family protein [Trichocoleus sp. FACHB-262]MBD2124426.1 choice-of-anchor A family protein [Trichocoleus sp. FACHB-262]
MNTKAFFSWVPVVAAGATAVLGFSTQVSAATVNLGAATGYNVFVLGDVNLDSDTEGKMAIAGDATLRNYSVGLKDQGGDALVVGDDLDFKNGTVYGNAVVGGTANLTSVDFQGGALKSGNPIDFGKAGQSLVNLSQSYLSSTATDAEVTSWGGINLAGTGSTNVFDLEGTDLANATGLSFEGSGNFIVNVSGKNVSFQNFGFSLKGVDKQNILFNFFEATNITASAVGIEGSILAPKAKFEFNNGQMNGTLVAAGLTGTGQFNHVGRPPVEQPPASVPEPATLAGLGFAAAALAASRRKTKQAA